MTQDTPAFFTLDRGTVSTSAALIAPVAGRYRMLASAAAPVSLDPDSLLEDLAWRVARTDASLAGSMEGWRDWSRLEVHSGRVPRAVLAAASAETGRLLERAFQAAGWGVTGRFFEADPSAFSDVTPQVAEREAQLFAEYYFSGLPFQRQYLARLFDRCARDLENAPRCLEERKKAERQLGRLGAEFGS